MSPRAWFGTFGAPAWRLIANELWTTFPIWIVWLAALGLQYVVLGCIDPAQYRALGHTTLDFALTSLLPAGWVVLWCAVRLSNRRPATWVRYTCLAAVFVLAPFILSAALFDGFPFLRGNWSNDTLRRLFEYAQLLSVALLAVHAYLARGVQRAITFFAVGLAYGALLENAGIVLGFFSEPRYRLYVPGVPAPLATMVGWSMAAYLCISVAEGLRREFGCRRSPARAALLATSVALSLDAQLDPVASLSHLWQWNGVLPEWFLSVPFCNFAAWFGAVLPFSWCYFSLGERADLAEPARNLALLARIPLLAAIGGGIWLLLMIAFEGGFSGPTFHILRAFLNNASTFRG